MISDIKPYPSAEIFNNKHRRRSVGLTGRPSFCPKFIEESGYLYFLFHAVFISLDHLLDHLSADRTGLAGGQVAVVTLLEIDAHLRGGLHLEAVKRVACLGDNTLAGTLSHLLYTPYFLRLCLRLHPYYFPPARFYNFFEVTMFVKSPAVTLGDIY